MTLDWAGHNTARTIVQMTAHYRDPALESQNRPFALLYLRTTEGMRDANNEVEFSERQFWDTKVIPTFANYYPWTPTPPGNATTCATSTPPGGSPSGPTPTASTAPS